MQGCYRFITPADFRHAGGQQGACVATGAANPLNLSGATAYTINAWVSNDEDGASFRMIAVERYAAWAASTAATVLAGPVV